MHKYLLFFALALFYSVQSIAQQHKTQDLEQELRSYLAIRPDGRNLAVSFKMGDLNADGSQDAAAYYCLEATDEDRYAGGGNALANLRCLDEGIVAFLRAGDRYVAKAHTSIEKVRQVDDVSYSLLGIRNGRIQVQAVAYGPYDPRCCPSQERIFSISYRNGRLY